MNTPAADSFKPATLKQADFLRLSQFIYSMAGIKLPPEKKVMLEGRLRKRMNALRMPSLDEYCRFIFDSDEAQNEYIHMIDAVTTNKTDFFREPDHFHYLTQTVLPELVRTQGLGTRKRLIVWSAGCSSGEEPYTLAMVLNEFGTQFAKFNFLVLATDISTAVLSKAQAGIYEHDRITPVPMPLRKKYLLKSRNKERSLVRIAPNLRACVQFERLNFMERDYGIREAIGVIFCRNVIIYFDRPTQARILGQLARHLVPRGYLFVGHSESLHNMDLPLVQKAPTIYGKM